MKFATSIAIMGNLSEDWERIKHYCDQSASDNAGIAVGILSRKIGTDFGSFLVKFILLFIDKSLTSQVKPTFRFSMSEIEQEGVEEILLRVGTKVIINAYLKTPKESLLSG
ncbi:MAG: hypothetical protein ACFFDT_33075 [Candidatus Hodarchaeota archaeon]